MLKNKRVLLIAGGGTLGTYVAEELLHKGAIVEVICPEEKISDNERLIFHQSLATEELLRDLFSKKHYDGIVNFLHYEEAADYQRIYPLLIANTDHLIFLSSYRVYADEQWFKAHRHVRFSNNLRISTLESRTFHSPKSPYP